MSGTVRVSEPLLRLGLMPFAAASVSHPLMSKVSLLPFTQFGVKLGQGLRFTLLPWSNSSIKPSDSVRFVRPFYGAFSVTGTVAKYATPNNLPLRRRVRLLTADGINVVRETWSSESGLYSFSGIAQGSYLVVAYDYQNTYRAVIADRVEAV